MEMSLSTHNLELVAESVCNFVITGTIIYDNDSDSKKVTKIIRNALN